MKKILVISLAFFFFSIIVKATNFPGSKDAVYYVMPVSGSPYYAWGSTNIGRLYDSGSKEHIIARTQFTFDLSTIPANATINSVSLSYSCSGMGNYYQFKIKEIQHNSNPQDIYSAIYNGAILFDNVDYNSSSLNSQGLTTLVNSKKGTYLYLGTMSNNEVNEDSYSNLDLTLSVSYSIPPSNVTIYLDNNFISSGGTSHGTMLVDGQNTTIPLTKLSISRLTQSTLILGAVSPQNDNQSHQMIWHAGITVPSDWTREGEYRNSNQNYSFAIQSDDDGKTYTANLRKNYLINRINQTEFDGNQTLPGYIVEQNVGQVSTPGNGYTPGTIPYNFVYWTDNLSTATTRNITPTDNQTYTALYKYPHHSNTGSFTNSGQRKVIKCDYGYLHLVYESMGYVWYERSTDNGASWHIMNGGKPIDKNPSKSPSIDFYYGYQRLIIVYQTWAGDNTDYAAIKAACFKSGQLEFITTVYEDPLYPLYNEINYKPAVAYASNDKIAVAWEDYGVWIKTGVLSFSTNQVTWNNIVGVDNNNTANINPTIAAYKTTPGTATFHLAWQNNYSTIRYCNLTEQSKGSFLVSAVDQVSQGCGFPVNYYPSINVSNSNDVQLVWIGTPYYGSTYRKTLSRSRTTGWSSSFAQYGNNILSPDVAFYTGSSVVSWSENPSGNTYTNKFIKYGSVKTAGTTGKDVRIFNASTLQDMHLVSFTTNSLPYAFTHSANLNSINKDNALVMASGVQAVAFKDGVEYFFRIGDINFNGSNIDFESFEDTSGVLSLEDLNTNLITNSFTANETNSLIYSIEYGVTDSVLALVQLQNKFISFKVELIDQLTGVVLADLNNIQMDGNNVEKLKTATFSFNITGLPSSQLAIRLNVNNDLNPEYAAAVIKSDESVLLKNNPIELNLSGTETVKEYALDQNYPNPFNPSTTIKFQIPKDSFVSVKVYDILGNEITTLVNEEKSQGRYEVNFNASTLASGIYIYKIQAGDFVSSKKMILLK